MSANINADTIIIKSEDMLDTAIDDVAVLLSINTGKYVELNKFGLAIWELLDGKRSISMVAENLTQKYDVKQAECETDVIEFATNLIDDNLVHIG